MKQAKAKDIARARVRAADDLTNGISNIMTLGMSGAMKEGAEDLSKGKYIQGAAELATPALFGPGLAGNVARFGVGTYNLLNEDGIRKTVNNFSNGDLVGGGLSAAGDILNAGLSYGGYKGLQKSFNTYKQGVIKRGIETALRTSSSANGLNNVINNAKVISKYDQPRLKAIGKYILTGKNNGIKGYYNSLAVNSYIDRPLISQQLNNIKRTKNISPMPYDSDFDFDFDGLGVQSIDNSKNFDYKQNFLKSLKKFKGRIDTYDGTHYTGFEPRVGSNKYLEENDVIDAFVYGKPIGPSFKLRKLNSKNYGVHSDYIKQNYPNKNIPIYETLEQDQLFNNKYQQPKGKVIPIETIGFDNSALFENSSGSVDVAGHLETLGLDSKKNPFVQGQDIWKFNPSDYMNKWLSQTNSRLKLKDRIKNNITRYIQKKGLEIINNNTTPVVFRSQQIPYYIYRNPRFKSIGVGNQLYQESLINTNNNYSKVQPQIVDILTKLRNNKFQKVLSENLNNNK